MQVEKSQIEKLADFITNEIDGEPSQSEGAGDCAIRIINRLKEQIKSLGQWVDDLQSGMYVNCVYCGHRYGPNDEVPASMADVLKEHIEKCPKHPMSALKRELDEKSKLIQYYETRSVPGNMPPIICLCGSTRFMDAFFEAGWHYTLKGYIVLSVGVCKHAADHGGEAIGQDVADKLDELHLRKIDLADEVLILNVGGYIGDSTRKELEYAKSKGKDIRYLEPIGE